MTQYAFHFDAKRCTGCKTCQLACADYKDLTSEFWYRRIYEFGGGSWAQDEQGCWSTDTYTYHVSLGCQHCDDPACAKVCPTGAMHKDPETGLVSVDAERCVGCGYCSMACPYNVPRVDRSKGHSTKCDGCAERVAQGLKPICVESCPLRALDFGPVEEIEQTGVRADIAPLPSASMTTPNLFIVEPEHAMPADGDEGAIMNIPEVM